jgi:hypothetical protein
MGIREMQNKRKDLRYIITIGLIKNFLTDTKLILKGGALERERVTLTLSGDYRKRIYREMEISCKEIKMFLKGEAVETEISDFHYHWTHKEFPDFLDALLEIQSNLQTSFPLFHTIRISFHESGKLYLRL